MPLFNLFDRPFGKIRLVPARVVQVHVMHEAAGEKFVGQLLVALELGRFAFLMRGGPAAQIDLDPDADAIHDSHGSGQVFRRVINVLVQINDAMVGTPGTGDATNGGYTRGFLHCSAENGGANNQSTAGDNGRSWFHERSQLMPADPNPQVRPGIALQAWAIHG